MQRRGKAKVAGALALLLLGMGTLPGSAQAAEPGSLEPLLKASDIAALGVKDVVLAAPDAYDRVEQLGFEQGDIMVAVLSRWAPADGGDNLQSILRVVAKDVTPVAGIGDEAYSYLGGMAIAFRKGKTTLQLTSGIDLQNGMKAFLGRDQLAALAKTICSRLR